MYHLPFHLFCARSSGFSLCLWVLLWSENTKNWTAQESLGSAYTLQISDVTRKSWYSWQRVKRENRIRKPKILAFLVFFPGLEKVIKQQHKVLVAGHVWIWCPLRGKKYGHELIAIPAFLCVWWCLHPASLGGHLEPLYVSTMRVRWL